MTDLVYKRAVPELSDFGGGAFLRGDVIVDETSGIAYIANDGQVIPLGGGDIAIGDPVTHGLDYLVLFIDGDNNLAQDAGFTFNPINGALTLTGLAHVARVSEKWIDLGTTNAPNIDFAIRGAFRFHPTGNFVVTFSNLPGVGEAARVVVEVDDAAGCTGTYPGGFAWSGGAEPTWSANVDLATIYVSGDAASIFGMQSFAG